MSEEMLTATVRQSKGKKFSRKRRHAGQIPAILYGAGPSMMLEMDEVRTRRYIANLYGTHRLVPLKIEDETGGTSEHQVLIQEIQQHPYKQKLLHLDFRQLDTKAPITLKVPLKVVGTSPGVKKGGVIQMIAREIPVTCLPAHIPEFIEVDVSNLDFNDSIRVNEVQYPESVQSAATQNYSLLTVIGRKQSDLEDPLLETPEATETSENAE